MNIRVIAEKELPDGSMQLSVEMDSEAEAIVLGLYNEQVMTEELISRFVTEAIEDYIEKKD